MDIFEEANQKDESICQQINKIFDDVLDENQQYSTDYNLDMLMNQEQQFIYNPLNQEVLPIDSFVTESINALTINALEEMNQRKSNSFDFNQLENENEKHNNKEDLEDDYIPSEQEISESDIYTESRKGRSTKKNYKKKQIINVNMKDLMDNGFAKKGSKLEYKKEIAILTQDANIKWKDKTFSSISKFATFVNKAKGGSDLTRL